MPADVVRLVYSFYFARLRAEVRERWRTRYVLAYCDQRSLSIFENLVFELATPDFRVWVLFGEDMRPRRAWDVLIGEDVCAEDVRICAERKVVTLRGRQWGLPLIPLQEGLSLSRAARKRGERHKFFHRIE